jgi:acetyl esterase
MEIVAMSKYALAPEFASQPKFTVPRNRWILTLLNKAMSFPLRKFKWSDEVEVKRHEVRGEGGHVIPVIEIAPKGLSAGAPALIDYHGGGFFLGQAPSHLKYAEHYALGAQCRVFFPEYRLSTYNPFPAPFDDCYATLGWVHANADKLGVDPQRVGLIGDSAGGALAAGIAQKAFDRGENPICAQILIYPVTDHESKTESATTFTDTPMWKRASNLIMWDIYLAGSEHKLSGGSAPAPPYVAPLHRESFAGLPPAVVEVAEFDPLRDEGRQYSEALRAAGVPVEFTEVKGAIHGYDMVDDSAIAEAVLKERLVSIRRLLAVS